MEYDEGIAVFERERQAFILAQGADGGPLAEICRKAGISRATCVN